MTTQQRCIEALDKCHQAQIKTQEAFQGFRSLQVTFNHRERDILRWISAGWNVKQIAGELGIVHGTAAAHVRRLCEKAAVEAPEQLVIYTMQQPTALLPGAQCKRGIHVVNTACPCHHCRAMLAA